MVTMHQPEGTGAEARLPENLPKITLSPYFIAKDTYSIEIFRIS